MRPRLRGSVLLLLLLLLVLAMGLVGCKRAADPAPSARLEVEFFAMGGIPIHVRAWDADEAAFAAAAAAVEAAVQRLEAELSVFRANSAISRVNAAAGEPVCVSPEARGILVAARAAAEATGGAFDPTVGPLIALWKAAAKNGAMPPDDAITTAKARVSYAQIEIADAPDDPAAGSVRLTGGGQLDLGGVAKGAMADQGLALLRAAGVRRALVEVGGDLAAYDERPNPEPFRVGVRHPRLRDELLGVVQVPGGGVVTSGDYERGFDIAGTRLNHIVDPRTGRPVEGVLSVTLVAPTGTQADALATGVFVLGAVAGMAFVEQTPGVEAVIVAEDATSSDGFRVLVSSGLRSPELSSRFVLRDTPSGMP